MEAGELGETFVFLEEFKFPKDVKLIDGLLLIGKHILVTIFKAQSENDPKDNASIQRNRNASCSPSDALNYGKDSSRKHQGFKEIRSVRASCLAST